MPSDENNKKELVDNWENEWIKLEFNLATSLITAGKASRMYYLTFFVSLNLAIYAGIKTLIDGKASAMLLQGANIPIAIFLGLALAIINLVLYLLYVRAHSAEKDHWGQICKIRQYFKEKLNLKTLSDARWFLYNENFKDPLKGLGYKTIIFAISLLTALSIATLIGLMLFLTVNNYLILFTCFIVFFALLFILALIFPNLKRE